MARSPVAAFVLWIVLVLGACDVPTKFAEDSTPEQQFGRFGVLAFQDATPQPESLKPSEAAFDRLALGTMVDIDALGALQRQNVELVDIWSSDEAIVEVRSNFNPFRVFCAGVGTVKLSMRDTVGNEDELEVTVQEPRTTGITVLYRGRDDTDDDLQPIPGDAPRSRLLPTDDPDAVVVLPRTSLTFGVLRATSDHRRMIGAQHDGWPGAMPVPVGVTLERTHPETLRFRSQEGGVEVELQHASGVVMKVTVDGSPTATAIAIQGQSRHYGVRPIPLSGDAPLIVEIIPLQADGRAIVGLRSDDVTFEVDPPSRVLVERAADGAADVAVVRLARVESGDVTWTIRAFGHEEGVVITER